MECAEKLKMYSYNTESSSKYMDTQRITNALCKVDKNRFLKKVITQIYKTEQSIKILCSSFILTGYQLHLLTNDRQLPRDIKLSSFKKLVNRLMTIRFLVL